MAGGSRLEFLFLNLGHFYDHLFILIYATVAALVLPAAFDMSYADLIVYATPGFIAFGAFALPAGWLADRWSRRGMMMVFFIGIGASAMLTGLARTPLEIGVGLFFIGVFAAIYHPVGITMVVEARPVKTGVALGINGVWGNMGVASAAVFAGALIDISGWRAAFVVPGAAAIVTGLAYMFLCRSKGGAGQRAAAAGKRAPVVVDKRMLVTIFIIIALTTTLGSFIFQSMTFALPRILEERLSGIYDSATAIGLLGLRRFCHRLGGPGAHRSSGGSAFHPHGIRLRGRAADPGLHAGRGLVRLARPGRCRGLHAAHFRPDSHQRCSVVAYYHARVPQSRLRHQIRAQLQCCRRRHSAGCIATQNHRF